MDIVKHHLFEDGPAGLHKELRNGIADQIEIVQIGIRVNPRLRRAIVVFESISYGLPEKRPALKHAKMRKGTRPFGAFQPERRGETGEKLGVGEVEKGEEGLVAGGDGFLSADVEAHEGVAAEVSPDDACFVVMAGQELVHRLLSHCVGNAGCKSSQRKYQRRGAGTSPLCWRKILPVHEPTVVRLVVWNLNTHDARKGMFQTAHASPGAFATNPSVVAATASSLPLPGTAQ